MEKAWEYEKEGMGMQYQYGQAAADAAQRRNLEMWNSTNYEQQRAHMENAGLSAALMYGGSGAGSTSTAGGVSGGGLGLLSGLFGGGSNMEDQN